MWERRGINVLNFHYAARYFLKRAYTARGCRVNEGVEWIVVLHR
jgi:hypothetical protein